MMGMMPGNKKIASIILAGKKPGADSETEESAGDVQGEDDVAMDSVATKIMSAIESKDKKALIEGLKDFLAIADDDESPEESEGSLPPSPMEGLG